MHEELIEREGYWISLIWILGMALIMLFAISYPMYLPSQNNLVQEHQLQFQNQTPLENPVNVLCGTGDWKLENYLVEGDCHDNVCDMILHVRCVKI